MSYIELPQPQIRSRKPNLIVQAKAMESGLDPVLAKILANRVYDSSDLSNIEHIINPKLANLKNPHSMRDLNLAAARLAKAIIARECIGIETDHDCDGQTSHALIYYNLVQHFRYPKNLIKSYIGHRLHEGYGLSESVVSRILQDNPQVSLLITADNGSSDEPRIAKLKAAKIDVIVTDHHQISIDNYPHSAYAFINPTREDCQYDPYIAGCMVAWLLMVATRTELIKLGYLSADAPKLLDTLDYVAVGTVADCVSFAKSHSNRAVVRYGLRLINAGSRSCWQACKQHTNNFIHTEDIGFKIAPLLNSDGRLANAFGAVEFLLAEDLNIAQQGLSQLLQQNSVRKNIQKHLVSQAIKIAKQQFDLGKFSICMLLQDGHPGVHGIAASRIKDYFGRPCAIFSKKHNDPKIITGSLRGVEDFNVKAALQQISECSDKMLLAFGGHKAAGGVTLLTKDFNNFADLFEQMAIKQLLQPLDPIIWSDGELLAEQMNLEFLANLKLLEPYGREFEYPVFHNKAILHNIRFIGDGTHARVELNINGKIVPGVWFGVKSDPDAPFAIKIQDRVAVAFKLVENVFNSFKSCELQIITMRRLKAELE